MSSAEEEHADRLFQALADGTRRDIVRLTLQGEHSVSSLARRYPMSFAAVQKHVAVLERAGIVLKRPNGREQLVRGNIAAVREVVQLLDRYEEIWRGRIARIDELLDEPLAEPNRRTTRRSIPMTVTDVRKDPDALTLTITATFDASVKRVWQIWEDPRQLERWWGPPTYPATVVDHDLRPGGRVTYFMTGPEGDRHHGWWIVRVVDSPHALEFEDGFADEHGAPNPTMPTTVMRVDLRATGEETTEMVVTSTFPSVETMEQLIAMGMLEGIIAASSQITLVLAS